MARIKHCLVPGVYISHRGTTDQIKVQVVSLLETENNKVKFEFDRKETGTVIYRLRDGRKVGAWTIEKTQGNKRLLSWVNSLGY